MTIQERLRRSNLIMLVVPVVIAGVLLAAGLGAAVLLLQNIYLPRLGLTLRDLHDMGGQAEEMLSGLKLFVVLYAAVVIAALLAAVGFTNIYLTRALFAHIEGPLEALVQGVQRIQSGDLETPIGYTEADEFRPACEAVDEMAARLRESLAQQQREQQKKQELIAGMSHDLKSPLTTIRAYTEALLEGVAPDEAARQRYLQTIYARETDLEALVNRLFELAKLGASEYPVQLRTLPLRETLCELLKDCDHEGMSVDCDAVADCAVTVDRELLKRVLHNLLDNSCKYGASVLQLGSAAEGGTVTLWVEDNGPGVSGGTIAFILGFYERFLDALHALFQGDGAKRKQALVYLLKLGLGWGIGMVSCVLLLSYWGWRR